MAGRPENAIALGPGGIRGVVVEDVQIESGSDVHNGKSAAGMTGTCGVDADDVHSAHFSSGGLQLGDIQLGAATVCGGIHERSSFWATLSEKTQGLWDSPGPAREVSPSHRERAPPRRTQDPRNVSRVNALDGQPTAVQGTSPVQDREPASNRTEKEQEEGQRGGDRKEEANSGHRGLGGLVPLGEGHWEVFLLRHRATFAGPGPSMWPRRLACCDSTVSSSHSRLWVSFTSR